MNPHNPDDILRPGNGYRFLDTDEIRDRRPTRNIEKWDRYRKKWLAYDSTFTDGFQGANNSITYRTKLTREQLARYT